MTKNYLFIIWYLTVITIMAMAVILSFLNKGEILATQLGILVLGFGYLILVIIELVIKFVRRKDNDDDK